MPYEVRVEHVEPRPIAVVKRLARPEQLSKVVPAACGEVWQFIRARGIPHTGLNLAVYLDGEMNLECGVLVKEPFVGDGAVVCSATPEGNAATVVHLGPYSRLGEAHGAVHEWCARNGYQLAGPSWEIYGHWDDDPAKLRTDVFWLLKGERPTST